MLKQEITEKITKYFNITNYEAEKIYDDIFECIIKGIKDDNISEISNFGEFIMKLGEHSAAGYKKTIEFLPSVIFEEEISNAADVGQMVTSGLQEEIRGWVKEDKPDVVKEKEPEKEVLEEQPQVVDEIREEKTEIEEVFHEEKTEIAKDVYEFKPDEVKETEEEIHFESTGSVEEDIKRKREAIIHKLDPQHKETYHPLLHVTEGIPLNVPKPVLIQDRIIKEESAINEIKEKDINIRENVSETKEEIQPLTKDPEKEIPSNVTNEESKEKDEVNELSSKSFSDYFKEVKQEQKSYSETSGTVVVPPVEQVIPPAAVELHKEIVEEKVNTPSIPLQGSETTAPFIQQNGNGYKGSAENTVADNSYYIWYKDSEPNAVDTQTMSYEYELLYQATKEAEYKSKLRIYVTTFILFFSVVLVLLIFSPVIYKYFFTPSEEQMNNEAPPVGQTQGTDDGNQNPDQQKQEDNSTQPVTNEQKQNTQPEQTTQQEQTTTQQNIDGVVKTDQGWRDEKNGVLYVRLENGKFAIQESAWNSEEKANNRISKVASFNISGMSGSFVKVDLGAKGTWYRVRFGEFTTLSEAQQKAIELKSKK
jgi:nucleoid DNA-binding protein